MSETFEFAVKPLEKFVRKFTSLCKKIAEIGGGEYETERDYYNIICVSYQESPVLSPEQIDLFYKFTTENYRLLEKLGDKYIGVEARRRLPGDLVESTSIAYDPIDDNYTVSVVLYSQHTARGTPKDKDERISYEVEIGGHTYYIDGDLEWNRATGEWVGVGTVTVDELEEQHELKEAVNKAVELARATAEEALKKLLEPG